MNLPTTKPAPAATKPKPFPATPTTDDIPPNALPATPIVEPKPPMPFPTADTVELNPLIACPAAPAGFPKPAGLGLSVLPSSDLADFIKLTSSRSVDSEAALLASTGPTPGMSTVTVAIN